MFDYGENTISSSTKVEIVDRKFPPELEDLLQREPLKSFIPELPDQLTINRYNLEGGDHIPAHVDTHSMCTEWLLSISFGSNVVMFFTNPKIPESQPSLVQLKSGSALLLKEDSRYFYRHGIQKTSQDLIIFRDKLALVPRGLRFSLTFRKTTPKGFKCQCPFPDCCDVRFKVKIAKLFYA